MDFQSGYIGVVEWLWLFALMAGLAVAGRSLSGTVEVSPVLAPKRSLLLISLVAPGESPGPLAGWVRGVLEEELSAEVSVAERPLYIPKGAFHPTKGQADAVVLVEEVERLVNPNQAVLGLTEYDLLSPLRRDLPFAMGARKGWAGLISTYRMEDKRDQQNTIERLRKMVIRYGAELVCDAPRNSDPESVLYEHLQAPEQLDIMRWP